MDVQQTVPPYKLVINAIILVRIVVQVYVEMEKKMVLIKKSVMMEILRMVMDVHHHVSDKLVMNALLLVSPVLFQMRNVEIK